MFPFKQEEGFLPQVMTVVNGEGVPAFFCRKLRDNWVQLIDRPIRTHGRGEITGVIIRPGRTRQAIMHLSDNVVMMIKCSFKTLDDGQPDDWVGVGAGIRSSAADVLPFTDDDGRASIIRAGSGHQLLEQVPAYVILMGTVADDPARRDPKHLYDGMKCHVMVVQPGGLLKISEHYLTHPKLHHLNRPLDTATTDGE